MKYYHKTPEELRGERERRREKKPAQNRSAVVTLLDIAVIVVIFAVLYYSGLLAPERLFAPDAVRRDSFEYTASLSRRGDGSWRVYLNA